MKKRIFLFIFFIIFSIICNIPKTMAVSELEITESYQVADFGFNPDNWNPTGKVNAETIPAVVSDKVGKITGFIRNLGIALSVISLMIIGFRTMVGSAEDKSQYKESLPGYLVGVIMVFSMTTIPDIIYQIMK